MSWATVAQSLAVAAGKALLHAITGAGSPKPSASAPHDATAERQGTATGAAANYSSKATERAEREADSRMLRWLLSCRADLERQVRKYPVEVELTDPRYRRHVISSKSGLDDLIARYEAKCSLEARLNARIAS